MKINSVTLINIRSYINETINFSEGVNFISGPNGTGKTTIVESIGFALFDAKPDFGRDTTQFGYFVRYGCASGAISVEIEDNSAQEYIFERKINKRSTSWTVYEKQTGSELNLQGSEDIKDFIKERIDIEKNQKIEDVFANIIGVSQGTFTMPFMLAPADRIKHFNTILNVLEYRKAADKGLDTKNYYGKLIAENEKQIAILTERLSNKTQVEELSVSLKEELDCSKKELFESEKTKQDLKKQVDELNELKNRVFKAEKAASDIQAQITAKNESVKAQSENLLTAQNAKKIITENKEAYEAYKTTQAEALEIEKAKEQREQLLRKKIENENKYNMLVSDANNKIDIYKNRQDISKEQISKANEEIAGIQIKIAELMNNDQVAKSQGALKEIEIKAQALYEDISLIETLNDRVRSGAEKWADNEEKIKGIENELNNSADLLSKAKLYEEAVSCKEAVIAQKAVIISDIDLQNSYISDIKKGICPLCHENCLDIEKVRSEINEYLKEIEADLAKIRVKEEDCKETISKYKADYEASLLLREKEAEVAECYNKRNTFLDTFDSLCKKIKDVQIEKKVYNLQQDILSAKNLLDMTYAPVALQADISCGGDPKSFAVKTNEYVFECTNIHKNITNSVNEAKGHISSAVLNAKKRQIEYEESLKKQTNIIEKLQNEIKNIEESIEKGYVFLKEKEKEHQNDLIFFDGQLSKFENVDSQLQTARKLLQDNKDRYELYMNNLNIASRLGEIATAIKTASSEKEALLIEFKKQQENTSALKAQFSEQRLLEATQAYTLAIEQNAKAKSIFEQKENELNKNEQEMQRLAREQKTLDSANEYMARLQKGKAFAKIIFDDVLKNAGEKIGGIYRQRLTAKANELFKEMTNENAELIWEDDYNVMILDYFAGEKRKRVFRQLSGGEQMAAALSVRLSFIAALTKTRIAFFDEPTTNLDSQRRNNLAELLPKVISDFTQVFVISHDDTFDSVTQNLIKLQKTNEGTRNL